MNTFILIHFKYGSLLCRFVKGPESKDDSSYRRQLKTVAQDHRDPILHGDVQSQYRPKKTRPESS